MRFAREITAVIAAPLIIWLIGWSHEYVFDAVIAAVGILAMMEFISLGTAKGYAIPTVLCIVVMLIIMAAFVMKDLSVELGMFAALLFIPASYVFGNKPIEESLPASAVAVSVPTLQLVRQDVSAPTRRR
jgi:CDP-diglyceride synthetase